MPLYTTFDKVSAQLPDDIPEGVAAKIDADIADASDEVDAWLHRYPLAYASNTQRFPEISATPGTPAVVEQCARDLATSMAYIRLKQIGSGDGKLAKDYRDMAEGRLEKIQKGILEVVVEDTQLGSSGFGSVEDEYYDGLEKPIFNKTDLDSHD